MAGPLLVRLEEAGPELLRALGGKAGNLARVKNQLGLPVPDGVVATLEAYRVFLEQERRVRRAPCWPGSRRGWPHLTCRTRSRWRRPPGTSGPWSWPSPSPRSCSKGLLTESRRLAGPPGSLAGGAQQRRPGGRGRHLCRPVRKLPGSGPGRGAGALAPGGGQPVRGAGHDLLQDSRACYPRKRPWGC